jgi:hypothetical protein
MYGLCGIAAGRFHPDDNKTNYGLKMMQLITDFRIPFGLT